MGIGAGTAAIAATVVTAAAAAYSGAASANAAGYQAQVAKNNAITQEQNAKRAAAAGEQQAQAASMKAAAQGGIVKAYEAANGVDVNSGSAVDVQTGQREAGELDTQNTLNNALLQAYGYQTQAVSDTAQADLYQSEADEAPISTAFGTVGAALNTGTETGLFSGNQAATASQISGAGNGVGTGTGGLY